MKSPARFRPKPTKADKAIGMFGGTMETPAEWVAVALECIDQAGLPTELQDEIAETLAGHVDPCPTCDDAGYVEIIYPPAPYRPCPDCPAGERWEMLADGP